MNNCSEKSCKTQLIIICGPTASGKTALAVELAKKLNSKVISADSLYVYKGLDVGTAKPTNEELCGIEHYMIDICDTCDTFSVGDYKEIAKPILQNLMLENIIPIVCGGTGFYINSLIYNLSYGESKANLQTRELYMKLAEEKGNLEVYKILQQKDPETALKLHHNDLKRVVRALEILDSGKKKSDINDDMKPIYNYKAFCIDYPREILYERINKRVDVMFENGLVDEVKSLINSGYDRSFQCMQGIGYKEVLDYLDGLFDLEKCKELIKLNTRHYAKRQITFFKKLPNLVYLKPDKIENLVDRIIEQI